MLKDSRKTILKFSEYWIIDSRELLLHDLTVYIFLSTAVRKKLMKIHHDNSYTDYFEIKKTTNFLQRKYYWQNLFKNVKKYVKTCDVCQHMKISHHKSYNELALLLISWRVWNFIVMNFIMSLFSSSQQSWTYDVILVIIDCYIKMIRYFSTTFNIDASELAELFIDMILKDYSSSTSLITNHRFLFMSSYWSLFCYQLKIKWKLNTAFHLQINDQTEC